MRDFWGKKDGKVGIEVLLIGKHTDQNYVSRYLSIYTTYHGNTLTEYAEKRTILFPAPL
jgi:hypothetical protein